MSLVDICDFGSDCLRFFPLLQRFFAVVALAHLFEPLG
jgi:hypothetical protein